ncbi:hypothetical protein HYC85_028743 [Camellia sinensis]|uniref:Uncharacterized protein n=1 Tax=Camellia sinensis TaxID=4442 RepID=A0A7J7FW55_CAMSI|nr:hypothetical protein HYC85_028743 [Camellia sinensis]
MQPNMFGCSSNDGISSFSGYLDCVWMYIKKRKLKHQKEAKKQDQRKDKHPVRRKLHPSMSSSYPVSYPIIVASFHPDKIPCPFLDNHWILGLPFLLGLHSFDRLGRFSMSHTCKNFN